ncbi:ankyrin repeat and LEM domain-containing protein 1 isoform X1 [Triplophysa dalaica]|uniref:ankyrin repeat and LEM domain-containing protein 1 isoform X1 n=1 Tax=Triplophysa dalaica TaxID=1582913 RepID=UPI0024DF4A11|nr:ankyrin repeat and LEM domain-containing protein 1 isoform X1 [Triplophysa dalaica]
MSGTQAESLLIEAVNQTDARCVDTLLCQGENPNTITRGGVAAVHLAAGKESERGLRCLRLLLQHGADANLRTSEDLTPLHIAASWGCFQNLRLLLRNGGDPNLKDQDGNKPSDLAEQEENSKCASLLQEYETHTSLEEHHPHKLQYSILSGPSMSDSSLGLEVSSVFDQHEPLSSTRLSSRMSRESQMFCLSDVSDAQPILSSTSVSVLDHESDGCPWRKSVTFREPPDGFPASSPEPSPDRSADVTLNLSDYSQFLGSERMATVFQNQGIDVTYPDDVFIFSKEANELQDEFEKTVVGPGLHHHDDDDDEEVFKSTVQPPVSSGSSEYNSCDSVPYTSPSQTSTENIKLPSASDDGKRTECESHSDRHQVTQLHFTPSPFVTGRTRSRQSRCSQRMSSSLSSSSSLFEQTLPTVTRSRRNTLRSPCPLSKHDICEETSDVCSLNLSDGDSQADTHLLFDSMADTVIIPESCRKETDTMGYLTSDELEESRRTESGNSTASLPETGCETPETRMKAFGSSGLTGCTPRYSMSRLSGHVRRRTLADISVISGQTSCNDPVEYLYTDSEEGHELIETHVPVTSNSSLCSSEDTLLYDWRSLQITDTNPVKHHHDQHDDEDVLSGLTDRQLRNKLIQLGEDPGPINTHTRPLYLQKYKRSLQKTHTSHSSQSPASHLTVTGYSGELEKALDRFILPDCQADELALCQQFDQADQNKRWREGFIKSSFNYLLLDPRVTMNLPYRSQSMSPKECFQTFINAVFYIGKGKRSRPYSHLYEALEYFKGDKTSKKLCSKVQQILQVWNSGNGVISLHCFQNVIAVEAYTREACMVDAVGLKMLTNKKRGDYYGVVSTWPVRRKRELGVHLLYRTMQIFLAEGERQLRPADIR